MASDLANASDDVAAAALRMRTDARAFLGDALAKGDLREARRWESELRKLNKMITQYRLDQTETIPARLKPILRARDNEDSAGVLPAVALEGS